jgi:hypothetical protein
MRPRRLYVVLVLLALLAGTGALLTATSDQNHVLVPYVEPFARLSRGDIYLNANSGQYELQKADGFRPRADVSTFPLQLPLNWAADPFEDRNWQFQLHAWRMIDPIIYEYSETGQSDYLKEAMAFMLDWWQFQHADPKATKMFWYDMATGIRAMRLAWLIDLLRAKQFVADKESTDDLIDMAETHVRKLRDPDFINRGN